MSTARVVLCDLDDTLFDHAFATRATLPAVQAMTPAFDVWSLDELDARHRRILDTLHLDVLAGRLTVDEARIERFRQLLAAAGADEPAQGALAISRLYREAYRKFWQPVPGAIPFLEAIQRAGVPLVIVTNNIVAEQRDKLERCGLGRYVDTLVTSEEVGITKPDPGIFSVALELVGVPADAAVMLGDAWSTDIEGAQAAGIRPVWLNRTNQPAPDARIAMLRSLKPADEAVRVVLGG